jgi:hypothetical protein
VISQGRDSRHGNETVIHDTYAEKNVENVCSYIFQDSYFFYPLSATSSLKLKFMQKQLCTSEGMNMIYIFMKHVCPLLADVQGKITFKNLHIFWIFPFSLPECIQIWVKTWSINYF